MEDDKRCRARDAELSLQAAADRRYEYVPVDSRSEASYLLAAAENLIQAGSIAAAEELIAKCITSNPHIANYGREKLERWKDRTRDDPDIDYD